MTKSEGLLALARDAFNYWAKPYAHPPKPNTYACSGGCCLLTAAYLSGLPAGLTRPFDVDTDRVFAHAATYGLSKDDCYAVIDGFDQIQVRGEAGQMAAAVRTAVLGPDKKPVPKARLAELATEGI